MSSASVVEITVHPLPPLPQRALGPLPEWAAPAVRGQVAQPWAENRRRFALKVLDDRGHGGWFGPVSGSVAAIVQEQIAPVIVGKDIQAWRSTAYVRPQGRHRSGAQIRLAVSAVELALWDLRSRVQNMPVGELFGGRIRTAIPAYATAMGIDIDHPLAGDVASWIVKAGFWGQKWGLPGHDNGEPPRVDARRLERLRTAIGDDARLCLDVAGRWDANYARQMLPILAECCITWVEDPGAVSSGDLARFGLAYATGEHDYDTLQQLRTLISGGVQVWQPDPSWNGGLVQSARMVELARELGIPCFPHGSGLTTGLHLSSVMPSHVVPAVEYHLTLEPLRQAVHTMPLVPDRGEFSLGDDPGLAAPYRLEELDVSGGVDAA